MLKQTDKKKIENPIKLGPIFLVIPFRTNYDFSKFVVRFGDIKTGAMKSIFESFSKVLEQSYSNNKEYFEEDQNNVYFSYYEVEKLLIISSDLSDTIFYDTYKKVVDSEKKNKLTDCFFNQSINYYYRNYNSEPVIENENRVYEDTFDYFRAKFICKEHNLIKNLTKDKIKSILNIDFEEVNEEDGINEYDENDPFLDIENIEDQEPEKEFILEDEDDDDDDDDDEDEDEDDEEMDDKVENKIDDVEMADKVENKIDNDEEMIDNNELGWRESIIKIFKEYKIPMKINEINNLIFKKGYRILNKNSAPQSACSRAITTSIKRGETLFCRLEPGLYYLFDLLSEEKKAEIIERRRQEQELNQNDKPPEMEEVEIDNTQVYNDDNDDIDSDTIIREILNLCLNNDKYEIIKKPDQQYVLDLKYFNMNALFKTNLIFEDNNKFNKKIKEGLKKMAEIYNITYGNTEKNDYLFNYYSENQIECLKYLNSAGQHDENNNQNEGENYESKKRKFEIIDFMFNDFESRELKRLKLKGHSNNEIKKLQYKSSIFNFPFFKLSNNEQIIYRNAIMFLEDVCKHFNNTKTNKTELLKEKKKLFKDMMNSDIANFLLPDVVNLLFRDWDKNLEEKMTINYENLTKKYLKIGKDDEEEEEELEEEGEDEDENKKIPFNNLTSILNLFEHIGRDLNLQDNFMSFFLCFFSLLSGLNSDFDEPLLNVILIALPGRGKTFVLQLFNKIFKEFVDMFTIRATNKVGTTKINKANHKMTGYYEAPIELITNTEDLRNAGQQQAKNNLLNQTDLKVESNVYLDMGKNTDGERIAKRVARSNSRSTVMCSIKSMGSLDGGARRFIAKILEMGNFDVVDLFYMKQFKNYDVSSKKRIEVFSSHLLFLTKMIFMYFIIHYTKVLDSKPIEYVTDFYTLLLTKYISQEYEKLYKKKIKTDTIKRVRIATRIQCLLRVIQKKFCYKESEFFLKKKIDPFTFYRTIQKEAYTNFQDTVFAINMLNDEFYNKTENMFLKKIMKKYGLDKLDNTDEIFSKKGNLVNFYNDLQNKLIFFEKRSEGIGKDNKVYINPNYIVINTNQRKKEFLNGLCSEIDLPRGELDKVLEGLKTTFIGKAYENIPIKWYEENHGKYEKKELKIINNTHLKLSKNPTNQVSFSDYEFKGVYRLTFNISMYKNKSNYTKTQFEIFKDVIKNVACYDKCGLKIVGLLNEIGKSSFLDIEKIVKEKSNERSLKWTKLCNTQSYKDDLRKCRDDTAKNKFNFQHDQKIRKEVKLKRGFFIKNLLKDENNKFKIDENNVSSTMKNLFKKDRFIVKNNIGELNRILHEKLLSKSK